ncbi:Toll/interleukin-1 receptor domain-containing protein [Tanacetum coccineum]
MFTLTQWLRLRPVKYQKFTYVFKHYKRNHLFKYINVLSKTKEVIVIGSSSSELECSSTSELECSSTSDSSSSNDSSSSELSSYVSSYDESSSSDESGCLEKSVLGSMKMTVSQKIPSKDLLYWYEDVNDQDEEETDKEDDETDKHDDELDEEAVDGKDDSDDELWSPKPIRITTKNLISTKMKGSSSNSTPSTKKQLVKSSVPIRNCIIGLANNKTWEMIVNKKFGVKKEEVKDQVKDSKEQVKKVIPMTFSEVMTVNTVKKLGWTQLVENELFLWIIARFLEGKRRGMQWRYSELEIQEMGHYIVRGEHPNNPEKHSRVWKHVEVSNMTLGDATVENDQIEAIKIGDDIHWPQDIMFISKMKKLRWLRLRPEKTPFPLPLTRSFRKLDLSGCYLEDGEIQSEIVELSNLQDLNLSHNNFSKLHFSLSQLTRLKLLNFKGCTRLVKLPELPSSIAIFIADGCAKLTSIGNLSENCKWLCYISLVDSTVIDGNRLLQSMLKGNAIEHQSMLLRIRGLEIPKQFTNRLYAGNICRLPLPENWCNNFCGFLICAVLENHAHSWDSPDITIREEASDDMRELNKQTTFNSTPEWHRPLLLDHMFMCISELSWRRYPQNLCGSSLHFQGVNLFVRLSKNRVMQADNGQIVMPIFYDVDPSDVRKQRGDFGEEFSKQVAENTTKAELWRKELVAASNISGWEPKNHLLRTIDEGLVGMRDHYLATSSVYMEIMHHFKSHCIIENIREESRKSGLKKLQGDILSALYKTKMEVYSVAEGKRKIKSMLCHSNVLVILDDVDDLDQLEALAGSPNWFGDGSRIIITTRDEHLLRKHKVDHVSPVRLLSHDEAIWLFNSHAYNEEKHIKDYEKLSLQVVSYADGLPLALKVLGSFLYDKDAKEWMSTMDRLRDIPESEIVDKLKISYDGLKPVEKELFLDIACFFRGELKWDTMEIFDACGFHPEIGIKVLIQKSLITIDSDERFGMHDLIQEMGHYIVRGEHPNNPEKHSRVWKQAEENDQIKAIKIGDDIHWPQVIMFISKMKKLRLVSTPDFNGLPRLKKLELMICRELEEIHPSLGHHRSLKSVHVSNCDKLRMFTTIVRMEQLESLHIRPEKTPFPLPLTRSFRKLDLSGCYLEDGEIQSEIVELSNLQYLNLSNNDLSKLHFSLSQLTRLKLLKLKGCERLVKLPELPSSIAIIIADGCAKLTSIGNLSENCEWLCYISLDESAVIDGNRLLQSMLKGNAIENQSMLLRIRGLEIPKQFTNRLYAGDKYHVPISHSPDITIMEEASDEMREDPSDPFSVLFIIKRLRKNG